MQKDASQQAEPTEEMHQDIPKACFISGFSPSIPDEEERGPRHHLPEEEQGEEVPCENDPQGAPDIKIGGHMLPLLLNMDGIKHHTKGGDHKDIGEDHAQLINPAEDQVQSQERKDTSR